LVGAAGSSVADEGFSAFLSTLVTATDTQLTGWSMADPYYANPAFDPTTGNFTVPATGRYSLQATINYTTDAVVTASLGAGIDPAFVIRRTSPSATDLVNGLLPLLDVNVALVLDLRAVLGNGTVTLAVEVELTIGDIIGLFYVADGLSIDMNIGGPTGKGVVWSVHRLA
jgi:hypothetical protein